MSTILFKDGEKITIPPEMIHAHLGNGYFLTREESLGDLGEEPLKVAKPVETAEDDELSAEDEEKYEREDAAQEVEKEAQLAEEKAEELAEEDEVSEEDIRLVAKDLGIRPWKNMGIDKLKAKIEEKQRGNSD